jgi:FlaA1/EpsC-like NDP-sugar epimerase
MSAPSLIEAAASLPQMSQPLQTAPIVLIGTRATLPILAAQLRLLPKGPRASGWIDVTPGITSQTAIAPVLGGLPDLANLHHTLKFSVALVCLPASLADRAKLVHFQLTELGVEARFITPLDELVSSGTPIAAHAESTLAAQSPSTSQVSSALRKTLNVSELIGRTPYGIDRRVVSKLLTGKRVLITGAGGSIGSEIARICAEFAPEKIILMERSENALFEIDRQIHRKFPGIARVPVLHDVVDAEQTLRQLMTLRPHIVFHAAAHKHVPLMEDHPSHAVVNNFFGTRSIADAALACGTERFVLISSDKAVNPTSVMGATKRLAEMYTQGLHRTQSGTRFSMVRFGNVLGSACSVLPIWTSQIEDGGPLTVTDPRMTRYFMTIHEAAALVIQSAAAEGTKDEAAVYVLDMGEPVRILDLAMRFARAHGFEPHIVDASSPAGSSVAADATPMAITLTGIRPGEKLHEELAYAAELVRPTPYPGINAWAGPAFAGPTPAELASRLSMARHSPDRQRVIDLLRELVPEMRTADSPLPSISAAHTGNEQSARIAA